MCRGNLALLMLNKLYTFEMMCVRNTPLKYTGEELSLILKL